VIAIPKKPPRKRIEADVMNDVRAWLGTQTDVRLIRNNVGALKDERGRQVTYGLGVGSCDLVGDIIVEVLVPKPPRARMIARCFAIELKAPGKRPSPDQVAWMNVKRQRGWAVGWSDSLDGVIEIVEKARRWEI